jgi:hypothetical protein
MERSHLSTHISYLWIKLRSREPNHNDFSFDTLSPEVRTKTLESAKAALPLAKPIEKTKISTASSIRVSDDYDDDDQDSNGDSSNDDRSDSMNPNIDDYQAAMDNHADQMNPNNDDYWSSRGY